LIKVSEANDEESADADTSKRDLEAQTEEEELS